MRLISKWLKRQLTRWLVVVVVTVVTVVMVVTVVTVVAVVAAVAVVAFVAGVKSAIEAFETSVQKVVEVLASLLPFAIGCLTERSDMEVSRYYSSPSFQSDSVLEEGKYG
jgi:ABC-type nickel/cobalt efflux system permease component RcnA